MSEQDERDYGDKAVQDEILGQFHGEGWTHEQSTTAIGNIGLMWQAMASLPEVPLDGVLEAAQTVHEAGLSPDFNKVFEAVVEACGLVIDETNPAKLLGFVYGLKRAGEAAIETYLFMRELAVYLENLDLPGLEEEE